MSSFNTQAIIIKRQAMAEADRLLTILTPYRGKFNAIAKGVRKPESRKGGNLELFNLAELKIAEGKNLDLIIEASVINSFENLKRELPKVAQAYYICELIDNFLPEDKTATAIFQLAAGTLKQLGSPLTKDAEMDETMKDFEIQLLKLAGFWADDMFKSRRLPQTTTEWRRFNRIFMEQILGRRLRAPVFVAEIEA